MIPAQPVTKTSEAQVPAAEQPKTLMGFLSRTIGLKLGKEPTLHEYCFNAVFFSAGALMMIGVFH